ncbi:MAG: PqiC family protein [Pseudomonadota bacterium]
MIPFLRNRRASWLAAIAVPLALAGCAASVPAEHFYSLSSGAGAAPAAAGKPLYIELQAIAVPQQVSRNQLVINAGAGRVELLEQERWAGPLASEIGQALSLAVSAELGAIDVYRTPTPENVPVYRVSVNVQRFESAPGQYALVDSVWSVRQIGSGKVLTCRSVAEEKVSSGYDALVAGHRRALNRLALDIARAVRGIAAGAGAC